MNILILTQAEYVYIPAAMHLFCDRSSNPISVILLAPPMSTHGGKIAGIIKHLKCFGLYGAARMVWKILRCKVYNFLFPLGRNGKYYSVRAVGRRFKIPVIQISKVSSKKVKDIFEKYQPDILVSLSCPQLINEEIRRMFPSGCINVHAAPLPKYRGLMPTFWVLHDGKTSTAVSVHEIEDKLDNGAIITQREVPIFSSDTWDRLVMRTKIEGAIALLDAVRLIASGADVRKPNLDSEATYFSFPSSADRKAFLSTGRKFF